MKLLYLLLITTPSLIGMQAIKDEITALKLKPDNSKEDAIKAKMNIAKLESELLKLTLIAAQPRAPFVGWRFQMDQERRRRLAYEHEYMWGTRDYYMHEGCDY